MAAELHNSVNLFGSMAAQLHNSVTKEDTIQEAQAHAKKWRN